MEEGNLETNRFLKKRHNNSHCSFVNFKTLEKSNLVTPMSLEQKPLVSCESNLVIQEFDIMNQQVVHL